MSDDKRNPYSESKVGDQRILSTPRAHITVTIADAPEVEVIEEDTEKALPGEVRTREKAWRPTDLASTQIARRGGSITDEDGA